MEKTKCNFTFQHIATSFQSKYQVHVVPVIKTQLYYNVVTDDYIVLQDLPGLCFYILIHNQC